MSLIKKQINSENLPKHVAIIMDGNGRWAKSRGEERTFGHKNVMRFISLILHSIHFLQKIGIDLQMK